MASVINGDIESMDVADNELVFYIVYSPQLRRVALWRSDGTAQGTYAVCNDAGFRMRTAGNNAYFPGFDKVHGNELWKSDGTVAGTVMVKNILPGAEGSAPYPLYSWKSKIYFSVDTIGGSSFWKSDGTARGTIKLGDIGASANLFASSDDELYFVAEFPGYGTELGKTDGTRKGTKLLKDIFEGTSGSYPTHLVYMNGKIYFNAIDKTHGDELWKSDGSTAGTKLLADLTPGSGSSFFSDICSVNNKLFISANTHIWISDGTNTGTSLINDPLLNRIDYKNNLIAAGNNLFLSGTTPEYGYELFTANALAYDSVNKVVTQTLSALATQNFEARILDNPIQNTLNVVAVSPINQDIHLQVINASGQTLITKRKTVYKGSNNITYNTVSWPHGIYFLKIITHDNSIITLKFSK
jgi:ELWxxDGT repeat protein